MKHHLFILLLCVTFPLAASEFPLCLYGVNHPADLKLVKQAGFTCIQTYQKDPVKLELLAQKAKKNGLKVVFYPDKVLNTPYQQKAQQWPILAWYLVDEPDVQRWSRKRVVQAHEAAKNAWPQHHTTLVIGQGKTKIPFYDIPDIIMMDWYPVPHLPLPSFGDNVRYVKEALAKTGQKDYPIWGVVQTFDWKGFKQYRPDNDRIGRFPTTEEIRYMSYDGIINGATGLFYFTFNHQGDILPKTAPLYWKRVKKAVREIHKFKKIIENSRQVSNPCEVSAGLAMKTWQDNGHLYSVLLNRTPMEQPLPTTLRNKKFKPLFGDKKSNILLPYAVLVLKNNR